MQTRCDGCRKNVKEVGRLTNYRMRGVTQKLCKTCKKRRKLSYR